MKQIKTVVAPLQCAELFDSAVNKLLAEGWVLQKREIIDLPGQISEAFQFTLERTLYAELERSCPRFEEVTL